MSNTNGPRRFVQLDNRIITDFGQRIGPTALGVYVALCKYANQTTRTCYPSFQTLAGLLGVSRPTAIKAIRTLEAAGLIEVRRRRTADGDADSNEYRLLNRVEIGHGPLREAEGEAGGLGAADTLR